MNLAPNVKISTIWNTTSGNLNATTGDSAGTTAGSSAASSTTTGGFAFASTGLDMSGFEAVTFIATVTGASYADLNAGFSNVSSTVTSTSWTFFPTASVEAAGSTVSITAVLDLIHPTKRYVNAIVQIPTSSAVVESVHAIQYGARKAPQAGSTANLQGVTSFLVAVGTTST